MHPHLVMSALAHAGLDQDRAVSDKGHCAEHGGHIRGSAQEGVHKRECTRGGAQEGVHKRRCS